MPKDEFPDKVKCWIIYSMKYEDCGAEYQFILLSRLLVTYNNRAYKTKVVVTIFNY